MVSQISTRFDQNDPKVVADVERLLIQSANGQHTPIPDNIKSVYSFVLLMQSVLLFT